VNHSNPLAAGWIAGKIWQSGEKSVKHNDQHEEAKDTCGAESEATQHLSFWGAIGVGFGVALRGSRSLIDRRYLLERKTQIVASVPLRMIPVKQKAILLATLEGPE